MTPNKLPPLPEKFRKRPVVIEAVQLDGTEAAFDAAIAFMGGASGAHNGHLPDTDPNKSWLYIDTLEGQMTAKTGDWIIKGVQGEFYPCKPDIFAATYEPAEALRQSQSLPAGAVAGLVGKWREIAEKNSAKADYLNESGDSSDAAWCEAAAEHRFYCADELEQALQADAREKGEADGMVLAPDYRGYANLGIGAYILGHSAENEDAELFISIATEAEKIGRTVGDLRDCEPGVIPAEQIAVRLRFENVAGLDALEQQLRILRSVHFAATQPAQASEKVTGKFRAALLWLLWCHQGGSSEVGQPIRAMLGIGPHDCMTDEQVAEAKTYATHPQPVTPAGGEVASMDAITAAFNTWPADIRKKLSLHDLRRMTGWRPPAGGEVVSACHEMSAIHARLLTEADNLLTLSIKSARGITHPPVADDALDSKRLDWLEQEVADKSAVWLLTAADQRFVQVRTVDGVDNCPLAPTVRAAIDAALNQRGGDRG